MPSATIAVVVIAALALPWALSTSWLWRWLPEQWDTWIIVAITADAALVLLAAIWWLWWRLPRRQVARLSIQIPDPKARADAEDNFCKTAGQALGGMVVLIGAGAAYWQFTQQQQTAYQQILIQQKAVEESRNASRNLLISNQVAKGFEQLAVKDNLTMRLGGIYGLEGVMNTSEQYHQPVLETLCAIVRDGTKGVFKEGLATDFQAAVTVIGRRADGPGHVNLGKANIPGVYLLGAHLSYATLSGAALSAPTITRTRSRLPSMALREG